MNTYFRTKDKKILLRVISGICGNIAAGWFGVILIVPGFSWPESFADWVILTRVIAFGIVFVLLAYFFERKAK